MQIVVDTSVLIVVIAESAKASPLDIEGIELGVSTKNVLKTIRTGRKRVSFEK